MKLALEAKVGIFVVVCFVLIAGMSFKVGDLNLGAAKGYEVISYMKNAAGLAKDSPVVMSGVEVGKVKDIELEKGMAKVIMAIEEKYKIPKNVAIIVRAQGFLGEKYAEFEILDGDMNDTMSEGFVVTKTKSSTDFDQLGNKFGDIADDIKEITDSLKDVIASDAGRDNLKTSVENVRVTTDALREMITMNQMRVNTIIENVEQITNGLKYQTPVIAGNIERASKNVDDILANKKDSIEEAIENIKVVSANLKQSVDNINSITKKIDEGKGSVGKLVNEEETVENLNKALKGLEKTFTKLDNLKIYLEFEGERLFRKNTTKGRAQVRIVPNDKRYYLLGLASHPDGKTTTTDTNYKENYVSGGTDFEYNSTKTETKEGELLFTAQYAHKLREDFFFRIGMMESEFGLGADYQPLKTDKLTFQLDAFDFPSKNEDRDANLRFNTRYKLTENFFVNGGVDEILNSDSTSVYLGMGVMFRDDDLKYLLGSTPMPK